VTTTPETIVVYDERRRPWVAQWDSPHAPGRWQLMGFVGVNREVLVLTDAELRERFDPPTERPFT
jgi:hypothetical protein